MATLVPVQMQEGDATGQNAAAFDVAGLKVQAVAPVDADTGAPLDLATENTLLAVKNALDALVGNTDAVETLQTATNNALTALQGYNDSVESLLTSLGTNTDGLEALLNTLGVQTDQVEPLLTDIKAATEAANTKLPALLNGKLPVDATCQNITSKFRDAFEDYTPNGTRWNETKGTNDLIYVDGNAIAASYLVISKSPLNAGNESIIESVATFDLPIEMSFGAHLSQRTLGQYFSFEIVDTGTPLADVPDLTISSISQATTVLTVNTTTPHGLSIGKSIGIDGVSDSRANYPALVVATVPSATQFTCTAGPAGTIASLTIATVNNSGFVYFRERLGRANDGIAQIFENATATNASLYVRSESGDAYPSGTVNGNHSVTINSSASVQAINAYNTFAFTPTTEYKIFAQSDRVQWVDSPVDSVAQTTNRLLRTQVCPSPNKTYKLRVRAVNNKSLTVPVAQIVSIVKTGTTTATVTTDTPHGLTTLDQVGIYGARDQAAFPNTAPVAVSSIVSATVFTVVIGTASTTTSYGGYVARIQGGATMGGLGALPQTVSTATLTNGILSLVGGVAWTGALIGDSVQLVGIRNNTNGATLGIDGAWRVRNISGTTLELEALGWTAPANFTITNCGGGVIKRTDLRISFVRIFDYERERVEVLAKAAGDIAGAIPVVLQSNAVVASGTLTSNEGTPLTPSSNIINSAATTNATIVKASAGTVYGVRASNNGATPCYVRLYNIATAPVPGTTVTADWLLVPAGSSAYLDYGDKGARFATGIGLAITGGVADTDTTAVALGQVKVVTSFV